MASIKLDVPNVHDALRQHGWAIAENAIPPDATEVLKAELVTAVSTLQPYVYPFGEQRRLPTEGLAEEGDFPVTVQTLLGGAVADVCALYGATVRDDLIVWSHEFRRDTSAIYGRPHFDRRHQLKVFVYLDDVGEDNGPTHVATEAPAKFHTRWVESWRVALKADNLSSADVVQAARRTSENSPVYRAVECEVDTGRPAFRPLIGAAGTIVFFDTSLAHFGGLVTSASSRRTVRRHCILS